MLSTACPEKKAVGSLTLSTELEACNSTAASSEQAVDNTTACPNNKQQLAQKSRFCPGFARNRRVGRAAILSAVLARSNAVPYACQNATLRLLDIEHRQASLSMEACKIMTETLAPSKKNRTIDGGSSLQVGGTAFRWARGGPPGLSPSNLRCTGPSGPGSCPSPRRLYWSTETLASSK